MMSIPLLLLCQYTLLLLVLPTYGFEVYNLPSSNTHPSSQSNIDAAVVLNGHKKDNEDDNNEDKGETLVVIQDQDEIIQYHSSHIEDEEGSSDNEPPEDVQQEESSSSSSSAASNFALGHMKDSHVNNINSHQQQQTTAQEDAVINEVTTTDGDSQGDNSDDKSQLQFGSVSSSFAGGISPISSSQSSTSDSQSTTIIKCPPTSCSQISTYDLLPILPNCNEYILCHEHKLQSSFSCPNGMRFDNLRKRCDYTQFVECECIDDSSKEEDEMQAIVEDGEEETEYDEMTSTQGALQQQSTSSSSTQNELNQICIKHPNSMTPLLSTRCTQFVSCFNGQIIQQQQCSDGTIFDSKIMGCNWKDLVDCPLYDDGGGGGDAVGSDVGDSTEESVKEENVSTTSQGGGGGAAGGFVATGPSSAGGFATTGNNNDNDKETTTMVDISDLNFQEEEDQVIIETTPKPTIQPVEEPTIDQPAAGSLTTLQDVNNNDGSTTSQQQEFTNIYDYLNSHRRQLNTNVFRSKTQDGVSYRSYWYQYQDFMDALQLVSGSGSGGTSTTSITGLDKHVFYVGQDMPGNYEYGLVNIAMFLGQSMVESIDNDACDEYHVESNSDVDAISGGTAAAGGGGGGKQKNPNDYYAISNACGQHTQNYQEWTCSASEEYMQCNVDRSMILQATTSNVYPNAPPPLSCRPRSSSESYTGYWNVDTGNEIVNFPYENSYGRTDVEGCCYWGRGAIQTKGLCNLGKLNYYLGKKASDDGRPSRYPSTDFCAFPEAICAAPESREMRWVTSMFEWTERIQSYDDGKGWNYMKKLKEFVDGGLNDNNEFVEATSGIVTKGCHDPPCVGTNNAGGYGLGTVHRSEERTENFRNILLTLQVGGEDAMLRALTKYFSDRQDVMNSQVLRSQTPQGQLYPSYRYQLPDFLAGLTHMAENGIGGKKFYMGEARMNDGVRYGIVNAIMFLSQAYKESIQYDACDENNWQLVNDRFPLSNACGQLGMSYQDMHCREDEAFMECPIKVDMEQVALTNAGWFQAPAPFKCGPRTKFPTTGFWDYDLGRENNNDAYANMKGRVDVEGCCWWGRGIIQTRGVCQYGKLNYYMGKRAADEGRDALYPQIDFCEFPQGVCSSDETYGGELQWIVGFFEWTHRIQEYDVDGWNYIEKLKEFVDGGYTDFSFVDSVSGIINIGCHDPPCAGFGDTAVDPHNKRDRNDTFQRFLNQLQVARNFRVPEPATPMPSPAPTEQPSDGEPTTLAPSLLDPPTESPTQSSAPTALQGRPPEDAVEAVEEQLSVSLSRFADLLLLSQHPSGEMWPSYLYTSQNFQRALKMMTSGVGPGEKNFFYIGDGFTARSLEYGLVNIAAFMSHAIVQAVHYDACDENSWDQVNFRYPIANSCGQDGASYQDEVCEKEDDIGLECEVDTSMEIQGVTHASWIGAPPPLYCGDRTAGYWDHITGLEQNEIPYLNSGGRSDVKGCCWWGRGVLQVRGVCSYGKLNHWIGAKAAAEGRPSLYPDIDFCKNPGAICSDRRAPELRWVTGMFHWVQSVQRNSDFNYFPTLKRFVDGGNYRDGSFMGMVNAMLGGPGPDITRRTKTFFNALRAFNLIPFEGGNSTSLDAPQLTFCGVDFVDAGLKCIPCLNNLDCAGLDLCHANVETCNVTIIEEAGEGNGTNATAVYPDFNSTIGVDNTNTEETFDATDDGSSEADTSIVPLTMSIATTTNYCGESWGDAATKCTNPCPSGKDVECAPGHYCFGDITSCSGNTNNDEENTVQITTSNYCGIDWGDAQSKCSATCTGGTDAECPGGHRCFGDIEC